MAGVCKDYTEIIYDSQNLQMGRWSVLGKNISGSTFLQLYMIKKKKKSGGAEEMAQ